jgi:lipopolysaccharide transport system permease protein
MMKNINIPLIIEFVKRDFTEKFAGSVLGSMWSFIWPLVNIMIWVIIFSKLMGAQLAGVDGKFSYSIYLIAAMLPWNAFSTTISRSTSVFLDKKNIISKINVALPAMPFYINLSEAVTFIISMTFFYIFLLVIGHSFSVYHLLIPFIFILQQLLAYAAGLILAVLTVFIRDLKEVIGITLQVWFWFTPIVYVKDVLPEWIKKIIVYNPAFVLADSFQSIFVWNRLPDITHLVVLTVATFLLLLLSYFIFRKLESDVKDFL